MSLVARRSSLVARRSSLVGLLALILTCARTTLVVAQGVNPFEVFGADITGTFYEEVEFTWRVATGYTVAEVKIYANSQLIIVEAEPGGGWPGAPYLFTATWDTRGVPANEYDIDVYYDDGTGNIQEAADAVPESINICPPALKVLGTYPPKSAYSFPNDEFFATQWNLHNVGQQGTPMDQDIDLPQAWALETGDSSVIVAVCDGLVEWNHQDLGNRLVPGFNFNLFGEKYSPGGVDPSTIDAADELGFNPFASGDPDNTWLWQPGVAYPNGTTLQSGIVLPFPNPTDLSASGSAHGTKVAGIIAAERDNSVGIAGIAGGSVPGARRGWRAGHADCDE